MRVFFVNSSGDYPNQFPPLGLLYLAATTRKAGHDISFYDLGAGNADPGEFWALVDRIKPEVFCLSLYTTQIESAHALIARLRAHVPEAKILVGGPHVSALPSSSLSENSAIDFEVIGEGEETLVQLLSVLSRHGEALESVGGLIYRNGSGPVRNGVRNRIQDLDTIPFPAFDLIVPFSYAYDKFACGRKVGICVSSRGCPYNCTFCNKAVFGNRYIRRSPENVIAEIEYQKRVLNIDEMYFVDDLFVTDEQWLDRFLALYVQSGIGLPWKCLGRVDQVGADTYRKMKKAGCYLVQFGVESGDEGILKSIRKNITLPKVENALREARNAGLNTSTFFIFGHPGETAATVIRTIDFALRLNADICHFFVLVPFPGTANYRLVPEELKGAWERIRYYHRGQYPISLCEVPPENLYLLEKQARYEFYGRWRYLWKNVFSCRYPLKVTVIKAGAFAFFFAIKVFLALAGRRVVSRLRVTANAENT